ncbi:uncharacterized protein SETTUDRAFT_179492 [Exserohilum turcica Et28A]|uniref:Uncharacterized protein n=1 Tax=Exserohilum turcicum (strain 28A) TaxID=671987 RepID=R0JV40_EXST2|nr:uncharacterized protein SETTUDRAFT_179492 [Exserohilum turcica Et28A]EOA84893.1 hypothetical protein SETTUDRAFT_179492 [Exserohilum turcica Et28A]
MGNKPSSHGYLKPSYQKLKPIHTPQDISAQQEAKATPTDPDLLDFTSPDWIKCSTYKLNALTWTSFAWASPSQASQKIWGHSTRGRLSLPRSKPSLPTSAYVKSHLEAVAQDFKRASVILRLQARGGCEKPCADYLGVTPLFGEVVMLIVYAADLTEGCEELVVWDEQDEWYRACIYFRDAVREDDAVWRVLCAEYGIDKYRALERAWNDGSVEWLLLDEGY